MNQTQTQTTTQRHVKCHPYIKRVKRSAFSGPWLIPALCKAYNWPTNLTGRGKIAIVELGGGWTQADINQFCVANGIPIPGKLTDISVDGTTNSRQNPPNDADYEVALDIQTTIASFFSATGVVPTVNVYWAQDIAPAILAAIKDGCDVFSCSWGVDEAQWGPQALTELENACELAVAAGMVIFAASGDNDSSDGGPNAINVDAPSSCPHAIGCGGTTKTLTSEVVWNNNPGQTNGEGTGGGFSQFFGRQPWQLGAPYPKKKYYGRMVPDVCANADPNTGYSIIVYGETQIVGGTSAVAPLYAGLFAAFGTKLGFLNKTLYKHQSDFNDITVGNNGFYSAVPGPDPCTGIGSPNGAKLATLF